MLGWHIKLSVVKASSFYWAFSTFAIKYILHQLALHSCLLLSCAAMCLLLKSVDGGQGLCQVWRCKSIKHHASLCMFVCCHVNEKEGLFWLPGELPPHQVGHLHLHNPERLDELMTALLPRDSTPPAASAPPPALAASKSFDNPGTAPTSCAPTPSRAERSRQAADTRQQDLES